MCGRLNVTNDEFVRGLCISLGINLTRSAGCHLFRTSRCLIPARGFGETEFEQQGKKKIPKHYHDLVAVDGAIAFGGLCKEYVNKETGEITTGCSVITLPSHLKFADIHIKASPLMLPQDATIDRWLDLDNQNIDSFTHLLAPAIRNDLRAIKIDKPSQHHSISRPFRIAKD